MPFALLDPTPTTAEFTTISANSANQPSHPMSPEGPVKQLDQQEWLGSEDCSIPVFGRDPKIWTVRTDNPSPLGQTAELR